MQTVTEGRIEFTGEDVFVFFDGKKIAMRAHPGTPQAGTWVSLEPDYTVRDADGGTAIEVEYRHKLARIQ